MAKLEVGNIIIIFDERSEWASRVARSMLKELKRSYRRGERRWRRET